VSPAAAARDSPKVLCSRTQLEKHAKWGRKTLTLLNTTQWPRERVAHLGEQAKGKQTPSASEQENEGHRLAVFMYTRRAAFCYPFCGDGVIYAAENEARRRARRLHQTSDACSRTLIMICATHSKQQPAGWSHNLAVY